MRKVLLAALLVLLALPLAVAQAPEGITYSPSVSTALSLGPSPSIRYSPPSSSPSELLTDLVSYWRMDEVSGTRVDSVGTNDLADSNTVGELNGAALFVQVNSESLTKADFVFPDNFTWSVWAYINSTDMAALPTVLSCGVGWPDDAQLTAYVANAGVDQFNAFVGSPYTNAVAASYFSDGWHLWNITFDTDNKVRIYLDTVLLGTSAALGGAAYRTPQTLRVGGPFAVTGYFGGMMKRASLHSSVLSSDQIAEMYNLGDGVDLIGLLKPRPSAETWLTYGDSKTANEYYQQPLATFMGVRQSAPVTVTYGPAFAGFTDGILAIGGSTVASMKALIDAHLASASGPAPSKILINLGANDVAALPAEAPWNADYGYILDAFHTKYPAALIYVVRPWRRTYDAECDTIAGRIAAIISTRSAWASVGPDERVFLKGSDDGVTMTSDGAHPNERGGAKTAEVWAETLQ